MGRAGAGRSGGSRSHSSHRSSSRSSGSHRVSSSRSYGSTRSYGSSSRTHSYSSTPRTRSYGSYSSGSAPWPSHSAGRDTVFINTGNPVPQSYVPGRVTDYDPVTKKRGSCLGSFFKVFVAIWLVVLLVIFISKLANMDTKSTVNREKLDSGYCYINECIVDELGWFDNISETSKRLQSFYNKTGVQPYIVLLDYMPSLRTDEAKEAYAEKYFDDKKLNENGFLFIYFAEENVEDDVGLMCYVNGKMTSTVMDSEAVEIFWNYIDRYWYTDMSTDDVFVTVFDKVGETIMSKSTTPADVARAAVIGVIVLIGSGAVLIIVLLSVMQKAKKVEEDAKILNTPLEKLSESDDLVDKYSE